MLNGKPEVAWSSDDFEKLQVATDFANAFIEALGPMKGKGY
ncbi:hypothetical protein [Paraburkholderia saeva]|nr:hypothetical protein [Paraburkholderia saeva]CAG4885771.1 hypothetical protein R70241_00054 [Paraburkholderia saeva]